MIGTEIGSYRILEKLGEGGMGVVFKAVDTSLDRIVAIKVLGPDLARNPELVQRFRNEAKAQANLNHTNLATLYAFLVQGDTACMVMEFVDGETFEGMIMRRGPIPTLEAVPMFKQALLGIGYAHRAGIVHRDIKPSNLMVNRMGIIKVMDFGIAKVMGTRGMTRTGTQMGTGWYMSPEQVLNKTVDIRSDIYSLGVTLYQMLSAHVPFEGDSDFQIMSDHVNAPPPPPTRFYPYIPKGVENAVIKALEKNPDNRFQTVEEFGVALERPEDFGYAPRGTVVQSAPSVAPAPAPVYVHPQARPAAPRTVAETFPVASTPSAAPVAAPAPQMQAAPQVQQPSRSPIASIFGTPLGKALAGVGLMLLLVAGWFAFRPKPVEETGSSTSTSTTHTPTGSTPLEQHLSQPAGGTLLSTATPTIPKVVSFRPNSALVGPGGKVHLAWSVTGATEVTITPGIGTVMPDGGIDVPLRKTTEFTLVAKNEKGETASSSTTVTVSQNPAPSDTHSSTTAVKTPTQEQPSQPQPPTPVTPPAPPPVPRLRPEIAFTAAPNSIQQGGFAVLRWYITNAQSASIDPSPGVLRQATGETRVAPSQTTTYTLTATSKDGTTATSTTTVQVMAAPTPPPPVERPSAPARATVTINAYHDHGGALAGNRAWPACWGQLQVVGGHLIFRVLGTNDGRRDDFDVQLSQVQEAKPNRVPIRNQQVFHVTISGQHFNFIPQGMAAVQAASLIEGAARQ